MIKFDNVSKHYNGKYVLSNINFEIGEGEIVSLLGHNGAGKTSLVKIMCGLLYQSDGVATVMGNDAKDKDNNSKIAIVLEGGKNLYQYLTVYENIVYFCGLNKIKVSRDDKELLEFMDRFKLTKYTDYTINKLSKGNAQKVSIVLALLKNPKLLLLDEPTNGLDIITSNELTDLILECSKERNITTIITTHDILFIEKLHCRIILLKNGVIMQDIQFEDFVKKFDDRQKYIIKVLKSNYKEDVVDDKNATVKEVDEFVYISTYNEDEKNKIMNTFEIEGFEKVEISLEDIYTELIKNDGNI